MSRLIDADALMKAMYHRAFETDGDTMWQSGCWVRYRAMEQTVKEQPTFEPEIIRCKDCKHFNDGDCTELPKLVSENDYCSFAEAREDEQTD